MGNTWPGGVRRALTQDEHERWNASNYPGTRQICCDCDEPTGNSEDCTLRTEGGHGPLCGECYEKLVPPEE